MEKGFLDQWGDKRFKRNIYKRIRSIAYVAWVNGYENVILGPIGCGAFGHDPREISKVFYDVFCKEFKNVFKHVELAYMVLKPQDEFGYKMFKENFIKKAKGKVTSIHESQSS